MKINSLHLVWATAMVLAISSCSLEDRARKGDVEAQLQLAQAYEFGNADYEQCLDSAYVWYERAAAQGDTTAISRMAWAYYDGTVVERDIDKALALANRGDSLDSSESQYFLAMCYDNGSGVKRDPNSVVRLLEKPVAKGNAKAQRLLGKYYMLGLVVEQNDNKAFELFKKSAEQGHPLGMANLALAYEHGTGTNTDQALADKWYRRLIDTLSVDANNGCPRALYNLGVANLFYMIDGKKNPEKAKELYAEALNKGFLPAAGGYARALMGGSDEDYSKAIEICEKYADKGDAYTMYNYGVILTLNIQIPRNYPKAFDLFMKSAEKGYPKACHEIAEMYVYGLGIVKDLGKSVEWDLKGIQLGDMLSMDLLSRRYAEGRGVPRDMAKSKEWEEKSRSYGFCDYELESRLCATRDLMVD